jgi:hypothetical protein
MYQEEDFNEKMRENRTFSVDFRHCAIADFGNTCPGK